MNQHSADWDMSESNPF